MTARAWLQPRGPSPDRPELGLVPRGRSWRFRADLRRPWPTAIQRWNTIDDFAHAIHDHADLEAFPYAGAFTRRTAIVFANRTRAPCTTSARFPASGPRTFAHMLPATAPQYGHATEHRSA